MTPADNLSFIVDWDRDGTFDHSLSNITAYVMDAQWSLGFQEPYQPIGGPSQLTLTLDNRNGDWNPLKAGSTFGTVMASRDAMIRIQLLHNAQTWYIGTYRIVDFQIAPAAYGLRVVRLIAQDWHRDLMGTMYDPPLTTSIKTGVAIKNAFVNTGIPGYPTAAMNFIVGGSRLDQTTKLPDYTGEGYANFFDGETTLDYVGDNMGRERTSLYTFISEMCAAEMLGRFRFQINTANGRPYYSYYGRTTLSQAMDDQNPHVVSIEDFTSAEYGWGVGMINQLEITVYPRKLGDAGTEIARVESAFALPGLSSRTLNLRYRDPSDPEGSCAAITIIPPEESVDYTANLAADGSGEDYSGNLEVAAVNKTNSADVTLVNSALGTIWVTLLKIRGTPLLAKQAVTINASAGESISAHGVYTQAMVINGVDDQELVQAYADRIVNTRGEPYGELRSVTFDYTDATDSGLATYVYEPLSDTEPLIVQDNWTEDTADAQAYWVAGMECFVRSGVWSVTLILESYRDVTGFWQLENTYLSILDQSTRLGF